MRWPQTVDREALEFFLEKSSALLLATLDDGSVLWANAAFRNFIGYNAYELYGKDNPNRVSWVEFSLNDSALRGDIAMARDLAEGSIDRYSTVKTYKPNGGVSKLCRIEVVRYPVQGELNACLVTVYPFEDGSDAALRETMTRFGDVLGSLGAINTALAEMTDSLTANFEKIHDVKPHEGVALYLARWSEENPKAFKAVVGVLLISVFGERLWQLWKLVSGGVLP